jgi:hypothetical protein
MITGYQGYYIQLIPGKCNWNKKMSCDKIVH